MNIGIDIDDTINNLHKILLVKAIEFNKKRHINFRVNPNEWDWDKACGWSEQDSIDFFKEHGEELCLNAEVKKDAIKIINKLYGEGHSITIITSRSKQELQDPYGISETWLNQKGIKYNRLVVDVKDKASLCISSKIEVFIDDLPRFCEAVSNERIKVLMVDSPYNQDETRYKRVFNWQEIYTEIKKMKEKK